MGPPGHAEARRCLSPGATIDHRPRWRAPRARARRAVAAICVGELVPAWLWRLEPSVFAHPGGAAHHAAERGSPSAMRRFAALVVGALGRGNEVIGDGRSAAAPAWERAAERRVEERGQQLQSALSPRSSATTGCRCRSAPTPMPGRIAIRWAPERGLPPRAPRCPRGHDRPRPAPSPAACPSAPRVLVPHAVRVTGRGRPA